jgi:WD40 repeat protein
MEPTTQRMMMSAKKKGGGGSYIAAADSSNLYIFDTTTSGSLSLAATYASSSITGIVFTKDNYLIATRLSSPHVVVFNRPTPDSVSFVQGYTLSGICRAVDISQDDNHVAVTHRDQDSWANIRVYSRPTPGSLSLQSAYNAFIGNITSLAFTPDGNYIVAGQDQRNVALYNRSPFSFQTNYLVGNDANVVFASEANFGAVNQIFNPSEMLFTLLSRPTQTTLAFAGNYIINSSAGGSGATAVSVDGQFAATVSSQSSTLHLFDISNITSFSLSVAYTLSASGSGNIRFSPNERQLAVVNGFPGGSLSLLNYSAGSLSLSATYSLSSSISTNTLAFSPD